MTTMRDNRVARALEWLATEVDHDDPDREPIILLGRGRAIVELLLEELGVQEEIITQAREAGHNVALLLVEADLVGFAETRPDGRAPTERTPKRRPGAAVNTVDSLLPGGAA